MDSIMRSVEIGNLLSKYQRLLTKRQADLLDLYFNQDLSLAEIAQQEQISRQGVHDALKRGEAALLEFENQLGILAREKRFEGLLQTIAKEISQWNLSKEQDNQRKIIIQNIENLLTEEEQNGI